VLANMRAEEPAFVIFAAVDAGITRPEMGPDAVT
jgi:hypothetical protein